MDPSGPEIRTKINTLIDKYITQIWYDFDKDRNGFLDKNETREFVK